MFKKIVAGICLCAVFTVAGTGSHLDASSLNNETEMAGISVVLEQYYKSCNEENSNENNNEESPETVVPVAVSGAAGMLDSVTDINAGDESVPAPLEENIQVPEINSGEQPVADPAAQPETVPDAQPVTDPAAQPEAVPDAQPVADPAVQPETVPDAQPVTDPAAQPVPEITPEPVSPYANKGISIAGEYVNIRKKPTTDSKILGKLYRGSIARIVNTVGDWVEITSGGVNGYIKSEYLAIGADAEKIAGKFGTKIAIVNVTTLKVREEMNTDCTILTLVPAEEEFEVIKEYDEWVKILVDDNTKGYVAKEYVTIKMDFRHAISIQAEREKLRRQREQEEAAERERLAREAAAREQAAREQAAREAAAREAAQSSSSGNSRPTSSRTGSSGSSSGSSYSSKSSSSGSKSSGSSSTSKGTGSAAASYAQNFIGNPYSYGGTSLTNGTDCSGFVQSVYSKYGVSLPRTSSSQSSSGSSVSLSDVQAGDLIFYASGGSVNHVAIYIGGGKVVHASNRRDGIKVSNMNYRTPCKARRVAN